MAAFGYHNENDKVVQHLHEIFGDKLNLDIIRNVAKANQFNVHQSSNELLQIANTEKPKHPVPVSPVNMTKNHSPYNPNKKSKKSIDIEKVINNINYGYKVIVIMRGLPGSGKSTLAKSILQSTIGYNTETARKHILSTDDFFIKNGTYQYDPSQISEAHGWNHQRAFNAMSKSYSPVIIDNTNSQMWEMKPYAIMTTDFGYILEILEPDTHWCFNDKELTKRNTHGVSKQKIKDMLDRYHKNVTPMKLLTAYDCKYKLQKPPQYRLHPPLEQTTSCNTTSKLESSNSTPVSHYSNYGLKMIKSAKLPASHSIQRSGESKETTNFMDFYEPSNSGLLISKEKQNCSRPTPTQSSSVDDILTSGDSPLNAPVLKPMHSNKIKTSSSLFDSMNAWGVDEVALQSWNIVTPLKVNEGDSFAMLPIVIDVDVNDTLVETRDCCTNTDDNDFNICRNLLDFPVPLGYKVLNACKTDINRNTPSKLSIRKKTMIDKSCLTEDFSDEDNLDNLAKIFPNFAQNTLKYWYKKCNLDLTCTMELLLTESDEVINAILEPIVIDSDSDSSSTGAVARPESSKQKRKNNSPSSDECIYLKKHIEGKVTIADKHYSSKLLKIKQTKYGETFQSNDSSLQESTNLTTPHTQMKTDENSMKTTGKEYKSKTMEEDYDFCFDNIEWEEGSSSHKAVQNETVELNIGDHFVKQLEDNFGDPNFLYPKGFLPVVQVPVVLARQLYTFYIESVYQQMEAQNTVMEALMKEDEEFARKLQESEEKTSTFVESNQRQAEPANISEIMREQKELSNWKKKVDNWKEDTPDTLAARLTRQKLFGLFPSVDKNALVEILHAHHNVYNDTVETLLASTTTADVNADISSIKDPPISTTVMKEMWEAHESCKNDQEQQDTACSAQNYRAEANRFLEQRTRLYQKAQRYYQSGMTEVAQFYSGLASKQTKLFEHANSLAATAFLDEHSKRLEDFNTLDLHFLYVKEALPNLDIFLDRNINLLRMSSTKNVEYLQIITGRGKNSKNGQAKIKPAVIRRLQERDIIYQLLNPGLLKIKVTKFSKVTSEIVTRA